MTVADVAAIREALEHTRNGINDGSGLRYTGWKTNGLQALENICAEKNLFANIAIMEHAQLEDLRHNIRRMLQALDAYWMNYEGRPFNKMPRGKYTAEDWWHRYEKYRALVVADL